ncbi:hypothetical protein [Pandoraea sputorum]|uniref:hypothetical protein n=1 Tax=Pandoraea sputorum TaxID=93222 RepID=UPI0012413951|nr:hypothetical protein [Pandoraea sputorum]
MINAVDTVDGLIGKVVQRLRLADTPMSVADGSRGTEIQVFRHARHGVVPVGAHRSAGRRGLRHRQP